MSNNVLSGLQFKEKYGTVFYKFLPFDLVHCGFKYQLGLNVDAKPSQSRGLRFTNFKNLIDFCDHGEHIALIEIPDDSQVYIEENYKFKADKVVVTKILDNDKKVLELLKINLLELRSYICMISAKKGYLETLKWARDHGCGWNELICAYAAQNGHLEMLKWARSNGCSWNEQTCAYAAQNGQLEILKWVRANGCPWDKWTCANAAEYGHLETLKWARSNGCPWDEWTCANAADYGRLEILKWARDNGCPWDQRTCAYAAENDYLEILNWTRENGCQCGGKYH